MVVCRCRFGLESVSLPEDTVPSLVSLTPLSTSSCTPITCSRPWVHNIRSICGGRSTWPPYKWFVPSLILLVCFFLARFIIYVVVVVVFLGAIYSNHGARLPIALHRMQLSQGLCLVDRNACRYVLLLVQWILQTGVQRTTAGEWCEKGEEKRDISSR